MIGQILHDTYRIERQLGSGGMATVYEATHLRLPRRFAVKVLHPSASSDRESVVRFAREAKVTSSLGHPNIVEVVDFHYTADGQPYLVMELLRGEDLAARMRRAPTLELAEVSRLLSQVASALDASHGCGVVHRDLKPHNLFLCQGSGLLKVLDFGISKVLHSGTQLTGAREVIGTPHYMSPEQIKGPPTSIDVRTDVYAVGAILYQVLSGELPFPSMHVLDLLQQVLSKSPRPLEQLRPDLPAAVSAVVHRALSKDKAQRQSSVGELARDFARAAGIEGAAINPAGSAVQGPRLVALSTPLGMSPAVKHADEDLTEPPLPWSPDLALSQTAAISSRSSLSPDPAVTGPMLHAADTMALSDPPGTTSAPRDGLARVRSAGVSSSSPDTGRVAAARAPILLDENDLEDASEASSEELTVERISQPAARHEGHRRQPPEEPSIHRGQRDSVTISLHPTRGTTASRRRLLTRAIVLGAAVIVAIATGVVVGLQGPSEPRKSSFSSQIVPDARHLEARNQASAEDAAVDPRPDAALADTAPAVSDTHSVVSLQRIVAHRPARRRVSARSPAQRRRAPGRAPERERPSTKGTLDVITRVDQQIWVLPVKVDGKPVGNSPVQGHAVSPGVHLVEVSHPGFAPGRVEVHVRAGQRRRVVLQTRPR